MNLFHLNIEVDSNVLRNADHDIRQYTDFIGKSIDLLKKETHAVKGIKKTVEGEIRFEPETPENRKAEKAVELLFNENTKVIFDQKDCFNKEKSIRIDRQNEDENYITLETDIKGNIIFLRPDTYQLEQQKKALDNLRYKPLKEHQPLLNLFGYPNSPTWQQQCDNDNFDWTILTDETKDGIREQRKFVSKAVQTKDFALMEGPPGSGKTTTIIELIMQFASQGKRILLCSATHAAVDNVIERIKGRYKRICDEEIIPVRISRFEQPVKESVKPYLLQKLVNTYKSKIEKHLKKNNSLESQKFLLENINAKPEQDPIEKIILDSANLVAGTMIGILQHPDIRANKQGASFDVLIVDEASKVTFSDFIVPALHAKKWILVGDVKQLSPYVENDYVSENIASMLPENEQQSIVKQFELKAKLDDKKFDDCLKVYFTDQNPNTEKQLIENRELVIETVGENWEANELNITKINSADVVIAKNDTKVKQLLSNNIQVKSIFINGETSGLLQPYRQNYFRQTFKKPLPYLFDSRQEEWAEMVSSRLSQSFSFRNAGEEFSNIDRELEYLIPCKLEEKINQIRRLVFPSILELLQNGVGKRDRQKNDRVLSDGFIPRYKHSRFVSLSYQHRMHPDIAKTSKENFYENNLRSANTVLEDRGWKYATNEPVVKWIHNNDKTGNIKGKKIINPSETNDIEKEPVEVFGMGKKQSERKR